MKTGFKDEEMETPEFPKRIEIEFSNYCNSKCSYCPRRFGVGDEGFMSFKLYKKIIDETERYPNVTLQLHRRGESLLHPNFIEMLEYIKGKFKEVQLATNAIPLDKNKAEVIAEVVSFISFSIDLPETYAFKRGVDVYKLVEENILNFLKINRKTITQVSMVKDNSVGYEDVQRFRDLWLDKVDRVRIYEEHSVGGIYGATRIKREKRTPCVKPFTDIVIYWNGKVVRCNHDWSNKPLGYFDNNTIREIWNNAEFKRIRKEQITLKFTDDICKQCDSWYSQEGKQGTGCIFFGN